MTRSHPLVLVVLVSALACSSGEEKEAPPPAPVAELSNQETIAFENTPGSTPALEDATVSFSRSSLVGGTEQVLELTRRAWHMQPFSDFWAHLLVAEGALEVSVEHTLAPWDIAALQVIVEEAGGRLTDLAGEARIDGGSGVSTNGLLHDEVLALLRAR